MTDASPMIHLDAVGGSPLSVGVRQAYLEAIDLWAAESGVHDAAARTNAAVETARRQVAGVIGAAAEDVVFTSGAIESRITAVNGLLAGNAAVGTVAAASRVEHPSTEWVLRRHMTAGHTVTWFDVTKDGAVTPSGVAASLRPDTAVVCLYHGQEDVGAVNDVSALVSAAREAAPHARVHVDACATTGLLPVDVAAWDADTVSVGGPALGSPGGVGALWVRPGSRVVPMMGGNIQESGRRSGALNVPGIVAMGVAAAQATENSAHDAKHRRDMAARLWAALSGLEMVRLNGPAIDIRIPGNLHVSVAGVTGETLAVTLAAHGVAVSPGSACSALAGKASPVLEAMGLSAPWTVSSVLVSVPPAVSASDIDEAAARISSCIGSLRAQSLVR